MENFVIAGKASTVFKLIALLAKTNKAEKAVKKADKK
jgi:hypothetical protein